MRFFCLVIIIFILPFVPAHAQLAGSDNVVGGDCSSYSSGATTLTADSDNDQRAVVLICDGSVWQEMLEPNPIVIKSIIDRDGSTRISTDSGDDDVVRFSSEGREIANIYASGVSDSYFRILTNSSTATGGFFLLPNSVNAGFMGFGYGSPVLNIDAQNASQDLVFQTQGIERMRIVGNTNNISINQANPFYDLIVNGDMRLKRMMSYSYDTSYLDMETADITTLYLDAGLKYMQLDGVNKRIEFGTTGDSTTPDEIIIGRDNNIWVERDDSARVGILTSTPDLELDVAGTIKLGQQAVACDASLEGGIRWSVANSCIEVCDGIAWECSLENACPDELPDTWSFTAVTGAPVDEYVLSNIVQITGLDAACLVQVKATGNGNPQYRICSDAACSVVDLSWTSLLSTIQNNKYIQVRTTSPSVSSKTEFTSLRVGARSVNWSVTTGGSCADNNPVPGTICADGTVYIGRTPDGFDKMFTTRCSQPRTFQGGSCQGYAVSLPWNDYSDTYDNAVGAYSFFQGQRNTTDLVNADPNTNSEARAPYGYMAAQFCDRLGDIGEPSAYGHTDWYLPSQDEIDDLCSILDPLGYDWNATHWASTETSTDRARYERGDCYSSHANKRSLYRIRCVRKENSIGTDISPDAYSFTDQTGVAPSTIITSDEITISGIDAASLVTLSGSGNPELSLNSGTTWASSGTINVGGTIMLRLTSSASSSTMSSIIVTIGGVNSTWNVTTGP